VADAIITTNYPIFGSSYSPYLKSGFAISQSGKNS